MLQTLPLAPSRSHRAYAAEVGMDCATAQEIGVDDWGPHGEICYFDFESPGDMQGAAVYATPLTGFSERQALVDHLTRQGSPDLPKADSFAVARKLSPDLLTPQTAQA